MTIFISNSSSKHPNKAFLVKNTHKKFLVPNLGIFFREILQSGKFEGPDGKFENSFLKY